MNTEFIFNVPEELLDIRLPDSFLIKYYEDISNRTIWINDEITGDFTHELIHYIIKWNREDKELSDIDRKPIYLLFDSPGGELDAQAAICSMIELSKTPIIGVAIGQVASAAALIYLSCHVRLALKSSYFILHKGGAAIKGDFENLMNSFDDYKKEVEKMVNFIIEHSTYSKEAVEEHIKKDWYVRIPEAVEYGLVDQIIEDINMIC